MPRIPLPLPLAFALVLGSALAAQDSRPTYDPLRIRTEARVATLDLVVKDGQRQRDFPILVYLPASSANAPVVLFSHGLGGSRQGASYLGRHWAARGYVAVFLQHPGSDEAVWKDRAPRERRPALEKAARGENLLLRCGDVSAVLDALERWNADEQQALHARLDLARVAMTGHSFGALTTQWIGGQSRGRRGASLADPRVKAAIAFSPSAPRMGSVERAFATVTIPWLLMTGTKDVSPIGDVDVENRLSVFPALPGPDKYELVLNGAEHSVFGDGRGRRADPAHHRAITALSTAFLDCYLKGDASARAWLDGAGPRRVLADEDRWRSGREPATSRPQPAELRESGSPREGSAAPGR